MTTYKVHVGGRRWQRFNTLAAAKAYCELVWTRTGVILTIIAQEG